MKRPLRRLRISRGPKSTSWILNLFFCVVFMPILVVLGPMRQWFAQWPWFALLACAFLYGCYFVVLRLNLPKLLIAKQWKRMVMPLLALVLANYLLTLYPLPDLDFVIPSLSAYQTEMRNSSVTITLWLMFCLVVGYALTISFVTELYQQLYLTKKIEAQRKKAELAMFKSQISPHFLFNTLNSLYSLVLGTSPKVEEAFVKFTDLLRYTYVVADHEYVPLSEEIQYIQNYIDLQLLRLNDCTQVKWTHDVPADKSNTLVPPMLMLTLVENAFKYGASATEQCLIEISLTLEEGVLRFTTRNRVMRRADEFRKTVPVGLENCRNRLETLFPSRFSLVTSEHDQLFTVELTIQLS
ncbi:MAG: sensor histidine kinase [Bacteroidales bacterium]|nr:sensor histidine kinase [Bacteroidales bacterium]